MQWGEGQVAGDGYGEFYWLVVCFAWFWKGMEEDNGGNDNIFTTFLFLTFVAFCNAIKEEEKQLATYGYGKCYQLQ